MRGPGLGELTAFVAVADHSSFSKAATALGISTSTMSQTIRGLEERLGVRLLNRTTRSVALTEAGDQLLQQIHPVLDQLGTAIESLSEISDRPAGRLRLTVGSFALGMVIDPILPRFRTTYPEITLDIVADDSQSDIVDGHFDAGIRISSRIERDMIAMRLSPDSRLITVAAPAYLASHRPPLDPADLRHYDCIRLRKTNGLIHPWEFEKDGEKIVVDVDGALTGNNVDFILRAALSGVGITYLLEEYVAPYLAVGSLVRVLPDWSLPFAGYHLFYPSRHHLPAKLRAFIDFMRTAMHTASARRPVLVTTSAPSRITAALTGTELLPGVALPDPDYVEESGAVVRLRRAQGTRLKT